MNLRYMNGKANGNVHHLTKGTITNTGKIWLTSKDPGAKPSPFPIRIQVYRDTAGADKELCNTVVSPTPNAGESVAFAEACGPGPEDDYYMVASKIDDDGWNVAGTGRMVSTSCVTVRQDFNGTPIEVRHCV